MLTNSDLRPSPRAISSATSTSKPTTSSGCAGSASTNGAPPSGSPAQRKTGVWAERVGLNRKVRLKSKVRLKPDATGGPVTTTRSSAIVQASRANGVDCNGARSAGKGGRGRTGRTGGRMGRIGWKGLRAALVAWAIFAAALAAHAQQTPNPNAPANFVKVNAPVVILTNARVIDGTGAPARENQTIVVRDGIITDIGAAVRVDNVPPNQTVVDLAGKTVMPGLVMVHEH